MIRRVRRQLPSRHTLPVGVGKSSDVSILGSIPRSSASVDGGNDTSRHCSSSGLWCVVFVPACTWPS